MENKNPWIIFREIFCFYCLSFSFEVLPLQVIKKQFSGLEYCHLHVGSEMRRKGNVFFSPCHNSPDVQRGANQGTSSVFTELDITTRQWKELCYLIAGEEPLGTLTLIETWKESLSHSVLSPSAVVTTSCEPFTHRSHSIVKADSGFAPVTCIM